MDKDKQPKNQYAHFRSDRAVTQENWSSGTLTRSDTSKAEQKQRMAIEAQVFGFRKYLSIYVAKTKALKLRENYTADLHLCFRIFKKPSA